MGTNDRGPVSTKLVGVAAAAVIASLVVCHHFAALSFVSLCKTWLVLLLVIG